MEIKLLSFDMFYTLADLEACYRPTWERILRRPVPDDELSRLNRLLSEGYLPQYLALPGQPFRTMREVFAEGFAFVSETLGLSFDPVRASEIFCEEHGRVPFYPEVPGVLSALAERYPLAVSSDADTGMIEPLLSKLPVRWKFVSEELGCYKADVRGRFFTAVQRETGFRPEEILHIGDSAPDIRGASACGIRTCLIARAKKPLGPLASAAGCCVRSLEELAARL